MARETVPAFQFYPKDFLSDGKQAAMSLAEVGAYVRLLSICWLEKAIPNDVPRLARMVGATPGQMKAIWPAVRACFQADPEDASALIHPRLDKERVKQMEFRQRQKENGRKGGRPKANPKPKPNPEVTQLKANSKPTPNPKKALLSPSPSSSEPIDQVLNGPRVEKPDDDLDTEHVTGQLVNQVIKRFCELYSHYRFRAKYHVRRSIDVPLVKQLLHTFTPEELEKMTVVLLTTDEDWTANTDRGIGILSVKASKLHGLISEYEAQHGQIQVAS